MLTAVPSDSLKSSSPSSDVDPSNFMFEPEGDLCRFFSRHSTGVESLVFTSDSQWLAVGRSDGQVDIYDVTARQLLMSLPGGENTSVRCLAFLPKVSSSATPSLLNYRLFSTGLHGIITEWDLLSQSSRFISPSFGGAIFSLHVYEPLGLFATANDDGAVRIFKTRSTDDDSNVQVDSEKEILSYWKVLTKHQTRLLSVCFYDENRIFAGTVDSHILGWNVTNGVSCAKMTVDHAIIPSNYLVQKKKEFFKKPKKDSSLVWCLVPLVSHNLLASGDSNGSLYLWSLETFTAIAVFHSHQSDILSLAVCPLTGNSLFSVGVDGKLCTYVAVTNSKNNQHGWILSECRHPHMSDARAIAISTQGVVATGSSDTAVILSKNLLSYTNRKEYLPSLSACLSSCWVQFCASQQLVLTVQPNSLSVWCLVENDISSSTLKPVQALLLKMKNGPQGWSAVRCAAINQDASWICVSNDSGTRLYNFNVQNLTLKHVNFPQIAQHISTALHFVKYQSQCCLLTATIDSIGTNHKNISLILWSLVDFKIIFQVRDIPCAITLITVSENNLWCATKSVLGQVFVYKLENLQQHDTIPSFVFFDGNYGKTSVLKPLENDIKLSLISRMAATMVFSPDSRYLAVFSYTSKYFMIYSLVTRRCLTKNEILPKQALQTIQPTIFRIQQLKGTSEDEIGRVVWMSKLEKRHADEEPVMMQAFLIQTKQCLLTRKFQIMETSSIMENEVFESPLKLSMNRKRVRTDSCMDDKNMSLTRCKTKTVFTRMYKPNNGHDFLHVALNVRHTNTNAIQHSNTTQRLIIFSQSKNIPTYLLPPAFARKRYAT